DHDSEKLQARKALMKNLANEFKGKYGSDKILLELNDQYYNMGEKIKPVMEIVDLAHEAMVSLGITPIVKPIRGGTDGSQLSYMGLPTPNIFTGGENFHGKFEFISVDNMIKATNTVIEIIKLTEQKA
ncbi:MAG: peptidase T, partial [Bacillus sp. (in: Bacteria)]|nr:peptidase T [Bacillus sp. (in: firmicutes)]